MGIIIVRTRNSILAIFTGVYHFLAISNANDSTDFSFLTCGKEVIYLVRDIICYVGWCLVVNKKLAREHQFPQDYR